MTRQRFFELAEECEISVEQAKRFWRNRPLDIIDQYTDEQVIEMFEASKSPIVEVIVGLIENFQKVVKAHEKAQNN